MDKRVEIVRAEIEQTRKRLLQKIDTLEEHAKAEIRQGLFGMVRHTASAIGSQLDVRQQVERHPLFVLTASAALAYWLFGRRGHSPTLPQRGSPSETAPPICQNAITSETPLQTTAVQPTSPRRPSVWDQLGQITLSTLATVIPPLSGRVIPALVEGFIEKLTKDSAPGSEQPVVSDALPPPAASLYVNEYPTTTAPNSPIDPCPSQDTEARPT